MNIATGLLVYIIAWWLFFFMLLPIGVRSHEEEGAEIVPGTVESAPARPNLAKKALWASIAAGVVFAIFYLVQKYELISLRDAL